MASGFFSPWTLHQNRRCVQVETSVRPVEAQLHPASASASLTILNSSAWPRPWRLLLGGRRRPTRFLRRSPCHPMPCARHRFRQLWPWRHQCPAASERSAADLAPCRSGRQRARQAVSSDIAWGPSADGVSGGCLCWALGVRCSSWDSRVHRRRAQAGHSGVVPPTHCPHR